MRKSLPPAIDREYLRRCRQSTPEQRLDWLVEALEFTDHVRRSRKQGTQTRGS